MLIGKLCDGHKRAKSGIARIAQSSESQFGNHAILADQRHRIGDRRNRSHFQKRRQQTAARISLVSGFEQSLRNLECDARSAKRLAWILTIRLIGIEYGQRVRKPPTFGQMVISDD